MVVCGNCGARIPETTGGPLPHQCSAALEPMKIPNNGAFWRWWQLAHAISEGYDAWLRETPESELDSWSPFDVAWHYQIPRLLRAMKAQGYEP